ncbi:MAG: fluoride efflux transporter CrcB [Propionibacteriaceae bacterium]|jgi:CrcB protein|nr:fluoride efflux transporter CrcB [Propionibacteriaceae bacterium]
MLEVFLVGIGGFAGCVLRYLATRAAGAWMPEFPLGTLGVNAVASFLAGALLAATGAAVLSEHLRLLASVGFCGGLSTFSAFSAETLSLLRQGDFLSASANAVLNVALSLACVAAGYCLASLCISHTAN